MAKIEDMLQSLVMILAALQIQYRSFVSDTPGLFEDWDKYSFCKTESRQEQDSYYLDSLTEIKEQSVQLEANLLELMEEILRSDSQSQQRWLVEAMILQSNLKTLQKQVGTAIGILTKRPKESCPKEEWLTRITKFNKVTIRRRWSFSSYPDIQSILKELKLESFQKSISLNRTIDLNESIERQLKYIYEATIKLQQKLLNTEVPTRDTTNPTSQAEQVRPTGISPTNSSHSVSEMSQVRPTGISPTNSSHSVSEMSQITYTTTRQIVASRTETNFVKLQQCLKSLQSSLASRSRQRGE